MALLLQQTDTDLQGANEAGVISACATGTISSATIESLLVEGGTPGIAEQTVDIPASSSRLAIFLQSANGVPGLATWAAGDWTVRFNVTTAQMDTVLDAIWVCRLDNAGATVATIASETGIGADISGGGVFTRTLTGIEHTGTDTDEIYIVVELMNNFAMTSRTVGITPDQVIDTPIAQAVAVAIGQAVETDTGFVFTPQRTHTVGLSPETDAAQAMSAAKGVDLGLASETGTAQPVASAKTPNIGLATETNAGQAVAADRAYAIGLATETDISLGPLITSPDAILDESGDALLDETGAIITDEGQPETVIAIGLATETDAAQPATPQRTYAAGQATEADTAFVFGSAKLATLGIASDIETGLAATPERAHAIALAIEAETAFVAKLAKAKGLGLIFETDEAFSVTTDSAVSIGLASESDAALALLSAKLKALGLGVEADAALASAILRAHLLGVTTETDTGLPLSIGGAVVLGLAEETDVALAITTALQGDERRSGGGMEPGSRLRLWR